MAAIPDTTTAVEWLRIWHPEGPWVILEIDPSRDVRRPPARTFTKECPQELEDYINLKNGQVNLYFLPNRVAVPVTITTTPLKDQITHLCALYVDLDLPKSGPYSAPTEDNFARLRAKIEALTPSPTALIFSGGGYQAFWVFDTPLIAADHIDRIEAIGKTIAKNLNSDAVQNVNRLMRLPGTINVPDAKKLSRGRVAATAEIVWADWGRTWSYATDDVPTLPVTEEEFHESENEEGRGLTDLPAKWQALVKSGNASDYENDRSRLVMAFISSRLRSGWKEEEILPFLIDAKYGISAPFLEQRNPTAVAKRQIARVLARVESSWDYTQQGKIEPSSPKNIERAVKDMGMRLYHNAFDKNDYINGIGPSRVLDDYCISEIRVSSHRKFGFIPPREILQDVVSVMARSNIRHPVCEYLDKIQPTWDQVPRTATWLIEAGATDDPFTRYISTLILVAAVRRVRQPGCEFHEMVVFISPGQGTGKSNALQTLCPDPKWYTDSFPLHADERKILEALSGHWIIECAELMGMRKTEVETIKATLSRAVDKGRPAYAHYPISMPRQCVFFGSTNSSTFLQDRENRRFWPVKIIRFNLAHLRSIRDQLWAEAATLEATGMSIRLPEEFWPAAAELQEEVRHGDPWVDVIGDHFSTNVTGRVAFADIWKLIGKPEHQRSPAEAGRITEVMVELGWEPKVERMGGRPQRAYVRGKTLEERRRTWYVFRDAFTGDLTVSDNPTPSADAPD